MNRKIEYIRNISHLINVGETSKARVALTQIKLGRLEREERFEVASAARRAGLPFLTLRLLSAFVRPSSKSPVRASEKEKAEYAAALVRVGAAREALEILKSIEIAKAPQALLYMAHALFTQWDYAGAIPFLERYLRSSIDDYQRVVGQVNLASALVHERENERAERALSELEEETKRRGLKALYGNTLERFAELAIQKQEWGKAERYLRKAERAVESAGGFDAFFVQKWRTLLGLYRNPRTRLHALNQFRSEAKRRGHWETVRECDAYRAIIRKDRDLLRRVYFGTPYPTYRARLLGAFGGTIELGDSFVWPLNDDKSPRQTLDLFQSTELKFAQLKHRLMRVLMSDFYRPFRVAHLFSEVHPGERFHINSSRARIHVGIRELREWLKERRIPIAVAQKDGEYSLEANRSVALVVPSPENGKSTFTPELNQIFGRIGTGPFSASEAAQWLAIPRRTAFEILRKALERGKVSKQGAGPNTRYCLVLK